MQSRVITGVDGHVEIQSEVVPFSAFTWHGNWQMTARYTAASTPHPDILLGLKSPLMLQVWGFYSVDDDQSSGFNPADSNLFIGQEVKQVVVFVNDSIMSQADDAKVVDMQVTSHPDVVIYTLTLVSSWQYDESWGQNN